MGHGPSVMAWGQGSGERKSLSFLQGQIPGMGSGVPRPQLFVKVGARAPVPYGVDATISDTLMVNPAGVMDVFSLYRLTPSISRLDLLLLL